jgi:hypothetical protein
MNYCFYFLIGDLQLNIIEEDNFKGDELKDLDLYEFL